MMRGNKDTLVIKFLQKIDYRHLLTIHNFLSRNTDRTIGNSI